MRQLYQNSREMSKAIQKYGCYYIDLCNIYQEVAEHQLLSETVNAACIMCNRIKNFMGKPYLDKECYVNDIEGISQILSGLTGVSVFMKQVKAYEEYTNTIGYFERVTNHGAVVGHFVELFNHSDIIKNDPWTGGSRTAKEGILKTKRYILTRRL